MTRLQVGLMHCSITLCGIVDSVVTDMIHQPNDAAEAAELHSTNISSPSSYQDAGDEFDMMANVTGEVGCAC